MARGAVEGWLAGGVGGGGGGWMGWRYNDTMAAVKTGHWLGGWDGGRLFGWRCIVVAVLSGNVSGNVLSGNVSLLFGGLARC